MLQILSWHRCCAFGILALAAAGLVQGIRAQPARIAENGFVKQRLVGRFSLDQYGFSVNIARTVIAYGPWYDSDGISGSSHGFDGRLSTDENAKISLFAEYVPGARLPPRPVKSNEEVLQYILQSIHPEGTELHVASVKAATLGKLKATRVLASYRLPGAAVDRIVDVTFGVRLRDPKVGDVLYQIELDASKNRYKSDQPVLEAILQSFRLTQEPRLPSGTPPLVPAPVYSPPHSPATR